MRPSILRSYCTFNRDLLKFLKPIPLIETYTFMFQISYETYTFNKTYMMNVWTPSFTFNWYQTLLQFRVMSILKDEPWIKLGCHPFKCCWLGSMPQIVICFVDGGFPVPSLICFLYPFPLSLFKEIMGYIKCFVSKWIR